MSGVLMQDDLAAWRSCCDPYPDHALRVNSLGTVVALALALFLAHPRGAKQLHCDAD